MRLAVGARVWTISRRQFCRKAMIGPAVSRWRADDPRPKVYKRSQANLKYTRVVRQTAWFHAVHARHDDIIFCGCSCSSSFSTSSLIFHGSDYENEHDDEADYPQIIMTSCLINFSRNLPGP
jgi:hypothetical protein